MKRDRAGASRLLRDNLIVVAVYAGSGIAMLEVTAWAGIGVAIWPGAGIGLGALLIGGPGCAPGLWLAALLTELVHAGSWSALPAGAGVASGYLLQALAGDWMVRRLLPASSPLGGGARALAGLLAAGPLACLLSAGMSQVGWTWLQPGGGAPAPLDLLRWWSADALGAMLLLAPALMLAQGSRPLALRALLPAGIVAGLLFAGTVSVERLGPPAGYLGAFLGISLLAALLGGLATLSAAGGVLAGRAQVAAATRRLEQRYTALEDRHARLRAAVGERLQAEAERDQYFQLSRDLLCICDRDGRIERCSPSMLEAVGRPASTLAGRPLTDCVIAEDRAALQELLERRHEPGREDVSVDARIDAAAGDDSVFSWYCVPGPAGKVYLSGRDVSRERRWRADLNEARERAEQASVAKSTFLATMSHEIRTPMNGVVGMIDVLCATSLSAYQRELLDTVQSSSRTLLRLIDDILDFSKIEAGRLELESTPVNLLELAEGLCDSLAQPARQKNVGLRVFVSPALPRQVAGDPVRLRQIMFNLMGNAIKFSADLPERDALVSLRLEPDPEREGLLRLEVRDNGVGMDESVRRRLFQPFTQGESSTTRRYGGTGLGLSICRRLVQMMQGWIEVASAPGRGSCFSVFLPLTPCAGGEEPPDAALDGVDCIVCDGSAWPGADIAAYLEAAGARVRRVPDLSRAGALARTLDAPVVIHDAAAQRPDHARLSAAFPNTVRHVALTRGRRRRPRLNGEVATLDADAIRRHNLLDAVAMALGRETAPGAVDPGDTQLADVPAGHEHWPGLKGLWCLMVGQDSPALTRLQGLLSATGVRFERVSDLDAAAARVANAEERAVVIQDADGPRVSLDRLQASFSRQGAIGHLGLTRGHRRRGRLSSQAVVALDADHMDAPSAVLALAVAAGHAPARLLHQGEPEPEARRDSDIRHARRQGRLILVAEDDATNRRVIQAQLGMLGMSAEIAGDGREALKLWRAGGHAVLLADLHMPDLDGYGLTRAIREEEGDGAHLPIIALTANATRGEPRRASQAGMDGYLIKPVDIDLLRATLQKYLPAGEGAARATAADTQGVLQRDVLASVVGGDPELMEQVMADFEALLPGYIRQMQHARDTGDLVALHNEAHKLKSAARSVGAQALGEICSTLEGEAADGQTGSVEAHFERFLAEVARVRKALRQRAFAE